MPMIVFEKPEDLSAAVYAINLLMLESGAWLLIRPKQPDFELRAGQFEFAVEYNKLIFSFWNDELSQSWRVSQYEIKHGRLKVRVSRQMGLIEATFEFRPADQPEIDPESLSGPLRRRKFEKLICGLIEATFHHCVIERVITRRDDFRQLSGIYTRLIIDWQGQKIAAIGVNPYESQPNIDGLLAAGLIWFDRAVRSLREHLPRKLMLFAPIGRATLMAERLTEIDANSSIELYEYDDAAKTLKPIRPFDQGNLAESLTRNYLWASDQAEPGSATNQIVAEIQALAPNVIEVKSKPGFQSISIFGLEFARCYAGKRPRVEFGIGDHKQRLNPRTRPSLIALISDIVRLRVADSPDRQHPYFTLQAERWLGCLLQRNIVALDRDLDERFVYTQVPAYKGDDRSYADLVTITKSGQLVVIELKVSEDLDLPFQGLDYWLRVDWHRRNGDFARRGYFAGATVTDEPPRLYLVAPLFRFHKTFRLLATRINPDVPVWRIGLNEHWRAGVQVLRRERSDEID